MSPETITASFQGLAYVLVVISGLVMIVGLRRLAGRLILLGILAAVVSVVGRGWLPT